MEIQVLPLLRCRSLVLFLEALPKPGGIPDGLWLPLQKGRSSSQVSSAALLQVWFVSVHLVLIHRHGRAPQMAQDTGV